VSGLLRGSRSGASERGEWYRVFINVETVGALPDQGRSLIGRGVRQERPGGSRQGEERELRQFV
jgi:hypothetical protein